MRLYKPSLHGVHLKIVAVLDAPFTLKAPHYFTGDNLKLCEHGIPCKVPTKVGNQTTWNITCCIGYSMDLLQMLQNDLRFHPEVYIVEDGYYGSIENGKWNGMIGDVYRGSADAVFSGLTINRVRSKVVDFSEPFMRVDLGIIISTAPSPPDFVNFTFLSFISPNLLWLLLAVFISGTILIYLFDNRRLYFPQRRRRITYPWREGFTYFSGLAFQRDLGGKNPSGCGARVTAVIFAFAMVITMTAYTAVMTATKVQQEDRNPFKGFKDERVGFMIH